MNHEAKLSVSCFVHFPNRLFFSNSVSSVVALLEALLVSLFCVFVAHNVLIQHFYAEGIRWVAGSCHGDT